MNPKWPGLKILGLLLASNLFFSIATAGGGQG